MLVHRYIYRQKVEDDGKFKHEGLSFYILVPVFGNEKAIDAMRAVTNGINDHISKNNFKARLFDIEYLGTEDITDFHEKVLNNKPFVVIPKTNYGDINEG